MYAASAHGALRFSSTMRGILLTVSKVKIENGHSKSMGRPFERSHLLLHQTVFRSGLLRILTSRVIKVIPSARAVAPIKRSPGSPG
jgi:hypothetical protein